MKSLPSGCLAMRDREIPVGRIAEPSDLRGAAIFLDAATSYYMTGQVMYVDGGKMAR